MIRILYLHQWIIFWFFSGFFSISASAAEPALPNGYLPLPLVRQQTDYSCGPASFLSILRYWRTWDGKEQDLYPMLKTTQEDGTHPKELLRVAKNMKLEAFMQENVTIEMLRESWGRGVTVILDLQAWRTDTTTPWKDLWDDGHYIVLIGVDKEYLYAMDPSVDDHYAFMPLNELYERWHDQEKEKGRVWKNYQLAIFMKGIVPGKPFPVPQKLIRIE